MKNARWLVVAFILLPALVLAQAQGRIKGLVVNSKGQPITNAKITMTCPAISDFLKEIKVDDTGSFATLVVDATKLYTFRVDAEGYQSVEETHKPFILSGTLELTFTLKSVAQLQQEEQDQFYDQPGIKELFEGQELLDAGKPTEARARFVAALEAKDDLFQAWHEIGWIDYKAGNPGEALKAAKKCLELSPKQASCLALAANSAKETGDEEAFERYMAAYKLANPEDPVVLFNEAAVAINNGDDATAQPLLERALELKGDYPDVLFQLGMIYLRTGNSDGCKELLTKFLEVAPEHAEAATAAEMLKYLQ